MTRELGCLSKTSIIAHRRGAFLFVEFGSNGTPVSKPEIVLEEDWHLSYPLVFEADGAVMDDPGKLGQS